MSDVVKFGWSGGKDSTCSVMLHLERGDYVKATCYIPMFTKDIPLISKSHYEFILSTAEYFKSLGVEVYFANGITYFDYVTHVSLSGKYKGQIFGFPSFNTYGICGFKRDSKLRSVSLLDVGYFDYEGVGIAFDEIHRHSQLNFHKRSILYDLKLPSSYSYEYCRQNNLLSPHYFFSFRDGCALCYNSKLYERQHWLNDYPEALPILIYLENIVKQYRPDRPPLPSYKYFTDFDLSYQLTFFD